MDERIAELVTHMGALDGAMRHMAAIIAEQERRILSLEAIVRPSPAEVRLSQYRTPRAADGAQ